MKRVCLSFAASLAIATLFACSSEKSTNSPTAPSLPALPGATVTTLVVTNQPANGNTIQMVATARMSDGSSQTVTRPFSRTIARVALNTADPGAFTLIQSGLRSNGVDGRPAFSG